MDLVHLLLDIGVPQEEINPILSLRPHPGSDEWRLVERIARSLLPHIGMTDPLPETPPLTGGSDPFLRYCYVYVFAAMIPALREWYEARGIDPGILRGTLVDLGRQMVHNRRRLGYGGLHLNVDWLRLHFTGRLFQFGRLQFERGKLGNTTGKEVAAGGVDVGAGDPVLAVHIPDYCGPFDPAACDASFARARTFFPQHFPEERYTVVTCHSWLLDRQLKDYLPESSNILAFQRRFTINHRDIAPQDEMFFEFVFGAKISEIDRLPRETTLQRALIDHVRKGGHWYGGVGWCRM
jgi:hypothetical protein